METEFAFTSGLSSIAHLLVEKQNKQPASLADEEAMLRRVLSASTEMSEVLTEEDIVDEENHDTVISSQMSVFFIFVALLVGQLIKHCSMQMNIPYTPLLTVLGMIAGSVNKAVAGSGEPTSVFQDVASNYYSPEPALIFLIFLPALIFESAFNSDWYTFKRQFGKILLMAGPMLIFSTFATAFVMYYVLQFENMSFLACVLFGAIISATDPVAVVSLLKELGVSKRIGTLIEGESLLNDGTALVLFLVLIKMVEGEDLTALDMIGQFCKMSLLGPLLGLAFGFIMAFILSRIHNQPILEANLTVCMPYILFYIAEHHSVHVSGILALVAMGLYMTNRGRSQISTESEHSIHAIWSYIGFGAETLIFLLTGIVLGGEVENVEPIWIVQLLGLYVFLHIIRFAGLILLLPLMRSTGYPLSLGQVTLLTYSGLRGAVGLCLALIVRFNDTIEDSVKQQVMFHTAGIVLLTLIVNGTTTGFVVRKLGLAKENEMSKRMLQKVLTQHDKKAGEFINNWKKERSEHGDRVMLTDEDLDFGEIKKNKDTLIKDMKLSEIEKKYPRDIQLVSQKTPTNFQSQLNLGENIPTEAALVTEQDEPAIQPIKKSLTQTSKGAIQESQRKLDTPLAEIRQRYLLEVKAAYTEHFEEGLVAPESLLLLHNSINEAMDRADTELYDFDFLNGLINQGCLLSMGIRWQKTSCIGPIVHRLVYSQVKLVYDIFQNYIVCSHHALHLLGEVLDIDEEDVKIVLEEAHQNLNCANQELVNLRSGYPQHIKQVDNQHCEYYALKQFTRYYHHLGQTGQIDSKHQEMIQEELDLKIKKLKLKRNFKPIDHEAMVLHSQLGLFFSEELAKQSCPEQDDTLVKPAELILKDADQSISVANFLLKKIYRPYQTITNNSVYLVARGCAYEYSKQDFLPERLDKVFAMRNKKIANYLRDNQNIAALESEKAAVNQNSQRPSIAIKKTNGSTKPLHYSKKITAGNIIGLQNILPIFADKTEMVLFTDNNMIAEVHEVNVELLRKVILEDKEALFALWQKLLPQALSLLHSQKLLELPQSLLQHNILQPKVLARYSELQVLDVDQQISLPAGGFLLQGSLEQIIEEYDDEKTQLAMSIRKSRTVRESKINNMRVVPDIATSQHIGQELQRKQTSILNIDNQLRKQVEQVRDRTIFEAFHAISPDIFYAKKDKKCHVIYSPNVKYTVVLALKNEMKDFWQTRSDIKQIQELEDMFTYTRGKTVLIRKLKSQIFLDPSLIKKTSHDTAGQQPQLSSMRLAHNYQENLYKNVGSQRGSEGQRKKKNSQIDFTDKQDDEGDDLQSVDLDLESEKNRQIMFSAKKANSKLLQGNDNRLGVPNQPSIRKIVTFKSVKSDSSRDNSPVQSKPQRKITTFTNIEQAVLEQDQEHSNHEDNSFFNRKDCDLSSMFSPGESIAKEEEFGEAKGKSKRVKNMKQFEENNDAQNPNVRTHTKFEKDAEL